MRKAGVGKKNVTFAPPVNYSTASPKKIGRGGETQSSPLNIF